MNKFVNYIQLEKLLERRVKAEFRFQREKEQLRKLRQRQRQDRLKEIIEEYFENRKPKTENWLSKVLEILRSTFTDGV